MAIQLHFHPLPMIKGQLNKICYEKGRPQKTILEENVHQNWLLLNFSTAQVVEVFSELRMSTGVLLYAQALIQSVVSTEDCQGLALSQARGF